jgi:glycosyltransferase involved in cell wall biosynthesis
VWQRKAKAWKNIDLTLVSPSAWLAKCASSSSLFKDYRVEVIPYGIDIQKYKPINSQWAREILNLPKDKQILLFGIAGGTSNRWKGFNLLVSALQSLSKSGWKDRIELLVFGSSQPENAVELGFKAHYLGNLADDISLATVYAAADVFVAPSVYDNLPNTVMEAGACGIPSVAFNIGGLPDMIEHCSNGYLAKPYETEDLARGIAWVLEDPERHENSVAALASKLKRNLHYKCKLARTKTYMKKSCKQLIDISHNSNPFPRLISGGPFLEEPSARNQRLTAGTAVKRYSSNT